MTASRLAVPLFSLFSNSLLKEIVYNPGEKVSGGIKQRSDNRKKLRDLWLNSASMFLVYL